MPTKMQPASRFCALRGVSVCQWHTSCEPTESADETGRLFVKSPLHPAKTLSVTVCVDVTVIPVPHSAPKNTVTPSHTVTLHTVQFYHPSLMASLPLIENAVFVEQTPRQDIQFPCKAVRP